MSNTKDPSAIEVPNFPQEVWTQLLVHLSAGDLCAFSEVSRKALAISRDPTLWKHLKLNFENYLLNKESMIDLLRRASQVERIDVCGSFRGDDVSGMIEVILQAQASLVRLSFQGEMMMASSVLASLAISRQATDSETRSMPMARQAKEARKLSCHSSLNMKICFTVLR